MRVMVSGGAGYVGSVSVERLLAAGHHVIVLDDLTTGHLGAVPGGAQLVRGSFGDMEATARTLAEQRIEAVLHCGAKSLVGESIADPAAYYAANVVGGVALLEAMRRAAAIRICRACNPSPYIFRMCSGSLPMSKASAASICIR